MNQRAILKRMTGLVRSIDRWGLWSIPWGQFRDAGVGLVLFEYEWAPRGDDARLNDIALAIRESRRQGLDGGVWFQVPDQSDPRQYALDVSRVVGYLDSYTYEGLTISHPHLVMLDFEGKPYQWYIDALKAYRSLRSTRLTAVTCEPDQDSNVIPHRAILDADMTLWPQCYGAQPHLDHRHPDDIVARMLLNNIMPHTHIKPMVSSGLAEFYVPGLARSGCEGFAYFVLDDASAADLAAYKPLVGGAVPGNYAALDRRAEVNAVAA